MKINWKVRAKKKTFWLALVPAILLLVQQIGALFGFDVAIEGLQDNLLAILTTVFSVLVILGIVTDPTTHGVGDSAQAMQYKKPKKEYR